MADIELIIKIPESYYKIITNKVKTARDDGVYLGWTAIANGTQLPKGHGRLIDENDLWFEDIANISCVTQRNVENAPAIIEADKETTNDIKGLDTYK